MSGYYDTAQICINGHVINSNVHDNPIHNQDHCDKCGAKTISKCAHCNTEIRGNYEVPDVCCIGDEFLAPNFCHKCGKPYPWTESKMEAFREVTDELSELTSEDKEKLKSSLNDIVSETPKTEVAGLKYKNILGKLGKESYDCVKSILVDIASETIKKSLFGK